MLYIFHGVDGPNGAAIRAETREAHQDYLRAQHDVLVLAGGTLPDTGSGATGSIYLLNVPDRAAAERFLENEPFYKNGLFSETRLTRMRKGHWHPENAPESAEGN